jgi:hypothetical protein
MRRALLALTIPVLFGSNIAFAQMDTTAVPSLEATSPLGTTGGTVAPTGLPLGSTEITTPGVSPLDSGAYGTSNGTSIPNTNMTGTSGMITSASPCSILSPPTTPLTSSTTSVFDGGGLTTGTTPASTGTSMGTVSATATGTSMGAVTSGTPLGSGTSGTSMGSGTSGPCGSSTTASTATSTTPLTPGGGARTGIPLSSFQINSPGVSPPSTFAGPNSLAGTSGLGAAPTVPIEPATAPVGAPTMIAPRAAATTTMSSPTGCAIGGTSERPGC